MRSLDLQDIGKLVFHVRLCVVFFSEAGMTAGKGDGGEERHGHGKKAVRRDGEVGIL